MQLLSNYKVVSLRKGRPQTINLKTLLAMKMLCILLLAASPQLAAKGYSQGISVTLKNASLAKLFAAIEKQTDYSFVYSGEAMQLSRPVTIDVKDESLENVLKLSFADQPLAYSIEEKFIIIRIAEMKKEIMSVKGRVVNENGEPVEGASVVIKGTQRGTTTDIEGYFELKD